MNESANKSLNLTWLAGREMPTPFYLGARQVSFSLGGD